jgi:hypothetical protein
VKEEGVPAIIANCQLPIADFSCGERQFP